MTYGDGGSMGPMGDLMGGKVGVDGMLRGENGELEAFWGSERGINGEVFCR